ncbi:hypothetical protein [Halococcus thailandensis]|uniref:hypothetical protein n=1 Tax=Halococcus thailandensis TaxID=335952 RepID=UPI001267A0D4|nr:hypothetical protein [Halococcus thailandensis]
MLDSVLSVAVSLITAVTTVLLTFYGRDRKKKSSSLKALETEISQNDIHTEMIAHDLFQFRDGTGEVANERTTLPLETSAYELVKNSGFLATLPPTSRQSIHYHYTLVRSLNRKLEQRNDVQHGVGSSGESSAVNDIDEMILHRIIDISDPRRLEVIAENLRENEIVESEFRNASESQPDEREERKDLPRQTYDGILHFVENEMRSEGIIPRLSELFSRM